MLIVVFLILWHVPIPRARDRLTIEPDGASEATAKRGGNGPECWRGFRVTETGKRRASCADRIKRVRRFEGIGNGVETVGIYSPVPSDRGIR